jgi:hypothetical protein
LLLLLLLKMIVVVVVVVVVIRVVAVPTGNSATFAGKDVESRGRDRSDSSAWHEAGLTPEFFCYVVLLHMLLLLFLLLLPLLSLMLFCFCV